MTVDKIVVEGLNFWYNDFLALRDINLGIEEKKITAIIGPSGCGKSTLLRIFNRMNDLIEGTKVTGRVLIDGIDIINSAVDLVTLRKKVGMVFQRPNPFPLSVYKNIAFGLEIHGIKADINNVIEDSLKAVMLWSDLKDKLRQSALELTLEQQQRLCIARLIAVKPEILLMDEPCSALDPIATLRIEELLFELKKDYTVVIVTHNMHQAARVSDYCGFMLLGELVEFGETNKIFTNPDKKETQDYISGRFG